MNHFNFNNIEFVGTPIFDEDEHYLNCIMISKNLEEFNRIFNTSYKLSYSFEDYFFTSIIDDDKINLFISEIPDLLFMLHNPSNDDIEQWDIFIKSKKELLNSLSNNDKSILINWYKNYAPLGITNFENESYVRNKLLELIK